jgi:outer membrane protein assembly factor BamB
MTSRWRPLVFLTAVAASLARLTGAGASRLPQASPAPAATPEDLTKQLVVMIRGKLADVDVIGAGIIVGIDQDRIYIVTANHVVRQGPQTEMTGLKVLLKWLPGEWTDAKLLADFDADLDVAVISVPGARSLILNRRLLFDRLGSEPQRKDQVYTIGFPGGQQWFSRVTADIVSGSTSDLITFETTFLQPGSSGGALVNANWEIVALVKQDQPPNGVAVRIDRVIEKLTQWSYPNRLAKRSATSTDPSSGTRGESGGRGTPSGPVDPGRGALKDLSGIPLLNRAGWPMFGRDEFHSNANREETTLRPPLRPLRRTRVPELSSIDSLTAAEAWLFAGGAGQGRNLVAGINASTGRTQWTYALAGGGGSMNVAPTFADNRLYVGGQKDDNLYVVDYTTGKAFLRLPGVRDLYSRHPMYRGQTLFYATSEALVALDVPTNKTRWTYAVRASQTSPVACGTLLAVLEQAAARDSTIAKLHIVRDAGTGVRTFDVPTTPDAYPMCWQRLLQQNVRPQWTIAVSSGNVLSAFFVASDTPVWTTTLPGDIRSQPRYGFADGILLVTLWQAVGGHGFVYALDGDSGKVLWRFSTGGPGIRGPAIANGIAYVTGWQNSKVFALDLKTGKELWNIDLHAPPTGPPIVAFGYLFVPVGDAIYVFGGS